MSGRERWGLVTALALLALAAPWSARADAGDACAERVFAALDVTHELRAVAAAAGESLAASARGLPAADAALLRGVVATGFDPARLEARAQAAFAAHCEGAFAESALAWLARDDVRSLLASGTGRVQGLPSDVAPDPARDRLLRRFDARVGREARAERMAARVLAAMLRVANPALPAPQRLTAAEIDGLLASQRSRAADPGALAQLRARYASVTTPELEAAFDFLSGPAGRWLRRELDAALAGALVHAAEGTAADLVELLAPRVPAAPLQTARATLL